MRRLLIWLRRDRLERDLDRERDFVYDVRFAARSFVRSPSFTAGAVVSLAIGIGATTAISTRSSIR